MSVAGAPSVAAFLRLVEARQLCRLGTVDYLRVERLIAGRETWTVEALSSALASLLATDQQTWTRLRTLGLDSLGVDGEGDDTRGELETGRRETPGTTDAPGTDGPPVPRRRWLRWLWLAPVRRSVLAVVILGALFLLPSDPPERKEEEEKPAGGSTRESSSWILEEVEPKREINGPPITIDRDLGLPDLLAFLASLSLMTLALRWWWLPGFSLKSRQQALDHEFEEAVARREAERAAGDSEREKLAKELLESEQDLPVLFQVPELPAVSERAIDDAAVLLGRLQHELPGRDELDVDATLEATVSSGGRAVPIFETGRVQATLLVLVDVEKRGHPYLKGFERVLDRWQKRGVRMLRFTFREQPDPLWPHPRGAPLAFDVLSRRHAGLPLVIFSRRLTHRGVTAAGAAWTRRLDAWPVRVWIDPDPTPLAEPTRRPGFRQDVEGLKRYGFARFGLDEADLPGMARYLAEYDGGVVPPPRRPLPDVAGVEPALRAWAMAAARVPEASWDLLEHFRLRLGGEIGRLLPERRHVSLLIRWINQHQNTPRRRHGAFLEIDDGEVEALRREQVASERDLPEEERFLPQVVRLLDESLQSTRPDGKIRILKLRWELKRAELELVKHPEEVLERLAEFRGGAVDSLAERSARALVAEASLDPAVSESVMREWSPEQATPGVVTRSLEVKDLASHGLLWQSAWISTVLAILAIFAIGFAVNFVAPPVAESTAGFFFGQTFPGRVDVLPKTSRLVSSNVLPETRMRPAMVRIPAGTFMMGSPQNEEGRDDDEDLHRVTITRGFYLAETEVTRAQYSAVMESNPSRDQDCGLSCPVESVEWFDAVRYANELSRQEGLEPCYEIEERGGPKVSWPAGLDCEGYRLPTEAEWEYAARAGSRERFAGTHDASQVCTYANVSRVGFPCDDGYVGLAPVASFKPNGFGLHDMTGNVYEWVWDWYGAYGGEVTDPLGPSSGQVRVSRGGSFYDPPQLARVASRSYDVPSASYRSLGFRVARSFH